MNPNPLRFCALAALAACLLACQPAEPPTAATGIQTFASPAEVPAHAGASFLTVYKSPSCGCCGDWMRHLEQAGLTSRAEHPSDMEAIKQRYGLAPNQRSCHTAVSAQGYVFEGHVPARYIQAFLADPPPGAIGLAVPAMPIGSPGMEMGEDFTPYDILLLHKDGSSAVYARVETRAQQYQPDQSHQPQP